LGIGLSLVRGLVRLHGGTVAALSEGPGHGSEFVVRLPLRRVPRLPPPRPVPEPVPVKRANVARRILVVEDNVDGARSLESLLTVLGHQVAVAHDGATGLQTARAFNPEVILLDIGLPGIDGYEVARRVRKSRKLRDVVLVAMTGWGKDEDRRKSLESGFNAHLVKPVELSDLQSLLANPMF
jgi:two-component system CheB/CheR fusion protein